MAVVKHYGIECNSVFSTEGSFSYPKTKSETKKTPRNVAEKFQAVFGCLKIVHRQFFTVLHCNFKHKLKLFFRNENLQA